MILPESCRKTGIHFSGSCMAKRKVSAPRLERPYRTERSGLSRKAWPDAEPWGPAVSLARAAVERRHEGGAHRSRRPGARQATGHGNALEHAGRNDSAHEIRHRQMGRSDRQGAYVEALIEGGDATALANYSP